MGIHIFHVVCLQMKIYQSFINPTGAPYTVITHLPCVRFCFFTILFLRLCEFVIINVSNLTCSVGPLEYALVTLPLRQSEPHANLARSHLSCHHEPDNQPSSFALAIFIW